MIARTVMFGRQGRVHKIGLTLAHKQRIASIKQTKQRKSIKK
jgi:hypothetical protein